MGSISKGELKVHNFMVPDGASRAEAMVQVPYGTDFDLSLWDDLERRTGGRVPGDGIEEVNADQDRNS